MTSVRYTAAPSRAGSRYRDSARTRQEIKTAASELFAERGYDAATVRAIASVAGVAPNLILRYFGSKEGLFLATSSTGSNIELVLPGPRAGMGVRLAEHIAGRWESADQSDPLLILLRAARGRHEAAEELARFLSREVHQPLCAVLRGYSIGETESAERAAAIEALIAGALFSRRVAARTVVSMMSEQHLASWLGHAIQALVDG